MRIGPVAALVLAIPAACMHSDPFPIDPPVADGPFDPSPPIRLTYNAGQDLAPGWRTGNAGLLYSFQTGQSDRDLCLGVLPEGGGARILEKCSLGDPARASRDALTEPSESPAGRLAWLETHHPISLYTPLRTVLRLGTFARADTGAVLRELPYLAPSGETYSVVSHVGWLGPDTLVLIGADLSYTQPPGCPSCPIDTLIVDPEIVLFDLTTSPVTELNLPGTLQATSVWPAADRTALFYTMTGDSRVFRLTLIGGAVTVAHDFGTGRVARDAQVRGNQLWAVVDGQVSGAVDRGGRLTVVDLSTGQETLLPEAAYFYKRLAVAPSGSRVVAEGYDAIIAGPDTTVGTVADLWQVDQ